MTLDALKTILSPPANPVAIGSPADWATIAEELGLSLPNDWRDFCQTYGSGTIWPIGLSIVNLFAESERQWTTDQCQTFADQKEEEGDDDYPYDFYPAPGGLLRLGATDQRVEFFYETSGDPDAWPIVIWQMEDADWSKHNLSLTDLLTQLLSGNPVAPFPKNWATGQGESPSFRPASSG